MATGCSSSRQQLPEQTAKQARDYAPPGPASDPWGPYIKEASARFSVPELWIREIMRQESGGRQYIRGRLTTSRSGAAGLMQLMPATYAELRDKHGLGDDRYHPRDNILAGTAYIREMYDRFGYPGFIAAYNAGPGRLETHLYRGAPLPTETVNYLASVAPPLAHSVQATGQLAHWAGGAVGTPADDLNRSAMAALVNRPPPAAATPVPASYAVASADSAATDALNRRSWEAAASPRREPVAKASPAPAPTYVAAVAPERTPSPPPTPAPSAASWATPSAPPMMPTESTPTPFSPATNALLASAVADTRNTYAADPAPPPRTAPPIRTASADAGPATGRHGIQVGAFSSPALAQAAADNARAQAGGLLSVTRAVVSPVTRGDGSVLYRAWLVDLAPDLARPACDTLARQGMSCMVLPPGVA